MHQDVSRWGILWLRATKESLRFALLFVVLTASACTDSSISLLPELANTEGGDEAKACTTDADCSDHAPRCNPIVLVCVDCLSDDDCGGGEPPKCRLDTWECVHCVSDADCDSVEPYCDPDGNHCEKCWLDEHCAAGEVCDATEELCVEAVATR